MTLTDIMSVEMNGKYSSSSSSSSVASDSDSDELLSSSSSSSSSSSDDDSSAASPVARAAAAGGGVALSDADRDSDLDNAAPKRNVSLKKKSAMTKAPVKKRKAPAPKKRQKTTAEAPPPPPPLPPPPPPSQPPAPESARVQSSSTSESSDSDSDSSSSSNSSGDFEQQKTRKKLPTPVTKAATATKAKRAPARSRKAAEPSSLKVKLKLPPGFIAREGDDGNIVVKASPPSKKTAKEKPVKAPAAKKQRAAPAPRKKATPKAKTATSKATLGAAAVQPVAPPVAPSPAQPTRAVSPIKTAFPTIPKEEIRGAKELALIHKQPDSGRPEEVEEKNIPSDFNDPNAHEVEALRNLDLFFFCDEHGNPVSLEVLDLPKEQRPRIMGFGTVVQHLPPELRPLPVKHILPSPEFPSRTRKRPRTESQPRPKGAGRATTNPRKQGSKKRSRTTGAPPPDQLPQVDGGADWGPFYPNHLVPSIFQQQSLHGYASRPRRKRTIRQVDGASDSSNDDSSDNSSADSSSGDESTQHMSTAPSASGESDQSSSSSSDSDGEERSVQSSPTSAPSVPVAATKAPKKGPAKSPNKTTKPTSKGPEVSAEVAELMRTDKECEIQPSGTEDELNLLECTFRFPPEYSRLRVWLPEITDWCLDYSEGDPTLWVITPYAWYKIAGPLAGLLPHPSYRSVFKHVRSLFEASYLVAYVLKEWLPINKKVSYRATLQQVVELSLKGRYPVSAWLLMENCQFIRNQIADLVSDKDAYLDSMFFRQLQRVSDSYKYREERTKKELEEKELKRKQREQERLERKQKQRDERDKRKDKKDQEKREREKEKKYPVEDMELLSENAPNIIPLEGEKWRGVDSTLLGDLIMAWQTICTFSSYTAMKPISLEALAGCMTADQHDGTSAELTRIFVGFLRSILSEKSFASLMDNLVVEGTVKVGDLFANTERIYGIGERPYLDMLNAVTWQEILRQLMSKELGIDASIGHVEPLVGCEIVRQTLFMQVTSTPFNSPVDTTLRGLEDYVEIIKQPMDLGTIRKKLEDGCYEVPNGHELFASDVRLIWENAVLYNGEQSEIGRAALALSDIFEQDYRRLVLGRIQANENRIEGCKRVKEFLRKSEVSSSVPTYADIAYGLYAFDFHKLPLPFKVGALAWLCGEFVNLDSVRTHLETQVEREAVVLRAHKKQASEIEARRKESERQRRQKEKEFRKECIADGIPLNSRDAVTDEIKKKHEFIGDFYEELDAETIEHEAGFEEERKAQEEALTNELKGAITREYPVGKDRFHNCYWVFKNDTKKRLFVEKSDSGSFFVCDSRDQLDALLQWLNPKGVREMDLLKTMNRLKDDLLKEDEGHSVNTSHGNGVNEVEEAGTINLFPLPGGAVPPETFELPKDGGSVQSLLVVKKMLLSLEKHLSHAGSLLPDWDATGHWRERVETSSACTSLKESLSKLEDAVADSPKKKETIRASWKRKRREWRLGLDGSENPTQLALLVHVFLAECVNVEAFMDLYIKFDRKEWLKLRAKECRNFIPEIDKHVIYFGDGHVQALKDDAKVKKKRFTRQSDPPIAHATLLCVVKNISFHHGGGDPYALLGLQPVPDPSTHSCARQPGKLLCPSPSPLQRLSRILLRVVAKLKSHENAGPFLEPVSDRDFPEYKELILHPMDISKMETKTRQLAYRQSSEFLADAKLICSNCELFCEDRFPMLPPLARNLVELTEGWLRKLVKELRACEKELSVDDGGASSGASQSTAAPKSENAKPQDIPREIIAILRLENRLPEYVVDVQRYENAVSRQWQPGERFRILFRSPQGFPGDFYGGVTAGSLPFGDNGLLPWEALRVTWDEDDGADDSRINPWEADIVTEKRKTK